MSEKKNSGAHFNEYGEIIRDSKDTVAVEPDDSLKAFTARLAHLSSDSKKTAQNGLTHVASNGKKAVQATNKQFKETVNNGIVMPAAKKVSSSPKMSAYAEDYISRLLTGDNKDDIEYE